MEMNEKDKRILELMQDLAIVESLLNKPAFEIKDNKFTTNIENEVSRKQQLEFKAMVEQELNLYSDQEKKNAVRKANRKEPHIKIFVDEVETVTYKEEKTFLWYFFMMYLLANKVKNRTMKMIIVDMLFTEQKKIIKIEEERKIKYD